jgi:hypothetical protein
MLNHYKRRLIDHGFYGVDYRRDCERKGLNVDQYVYRTTGQPCSCEGCRGERYDRNKEKRKQFDLDE